MAETLSAEQAAAAIGDVRQYRQGLTARAAGLVWMIWGLALALMALVEMGAAPLDPGQGEGLSSRFGAPLPGLIGPLAIVAATLISNAIWKSHALARDETHRPWVAWAVVGGIVVAFNLVGLLILLSVVAVADGHSPGLTYIFATPIFTASGAVALSLLLRKRVQAWPGLVGAAAILLVIPIADLVTSGTVEDKLTQSASLHAIAVLVVFVAIGLHLFRRG